MAVGRQIDEFDGGDRPRRFAYARHQGRKAPAPRSINGDRDRAVLAQIQSHRAERHTAKAEMARSGAARTDRTSLVPKAGRRQNPRAAVGTRRRIPTAVDAPVITETPPVIDEAASAKIFEHDAPVGGAEAMSDDTPLAQQQGHRSVGGAVAGSGDVRPAAARVQIAPDHADDAAKRPGPHINPRARKLATASRATTT